MKDVAEWLYPVVLCSVFLFGLRQSLYVAVNFKTLTTCRDGPKEVGIAGNSSTIAVVFQVETMVSLT